MAKALICGGHSLIDRGLPARQCLRGNPTLPNGWPNRFSRVARQVTPAGPDGHCPCSRHYGYVHSHLCSRQQNVQWE